jgi:hypothetical protein
MFERIVIEADTSDDSRSCACSFYNTLYEMRRLCGHRGCAPGCPRSPRAAFAALAISG